MSKQSTTKTWNDLCVAMEIYIADYGDDTANVPLRVAHWSDPDRNDIEITYEPGYPALIITLPAACKE